MKVPQWAYGRLHRDRPVVPSSEREGLFHGSHGLEGAAQEP